MKLPFALLAIARPLYTPPEVGLAMTALVKFTFGFQPRIVPSSVAKMKNDLPDMEPWEIAKSFVALNTMPVGVPPVGAPGAGIVTTRGEGPTGKACPFALYRVDRPDPLSETQKGEVELETRPQGLTRLGSVKRATPAISETRFTRVYRCPGGTWACVVTVANNSKGKNGPNRFIQSSRNRDIGAGLFNRRDCELGKVWTLNGNQTREFLSTVCRGKLVSSIWRVV